jgi:hypothetical protein
VCHRGVEDLGGGLPAKDLAGPVVEALLDREQVRQSVDAEIGPLGEVLAQQPVGRSLSVSGIARQLKACWLWLVLRWGLGVADRAG